MTNIRLFFPESLSLNFESKLDRKQSHYLTKKEDTPFWKEEEIL